MPEQQYTFVHPVDHQPYHTDRRTAEMLQDVKRREPAAYDAAFERGRETGRIAEGVAPAVSSEQQPHTRLVSHACGANRRTHPSVGD